MKSNWFVKNAGKALIILNVLGLIMICFLGEIATKIFLPEILPLHINKDLFAYNVYGETFANRKSVDTVAVGVPVNTDEEGFRINPANSNRGNENNGSLYFIGDSIVFGYGVKVENTFVEHLRRDYPGYHLINAGVLGYNLKDYKNFIDYYVIKNRGMKKIDYVVMGLCLNDFNLDVLPKSEILKEQISQQNRAKKDPHLLTKLKSVTSLVNINKFLRGNSRFYLLVKNLIDDTEKRLFMFDYNLHQQENKSYTEGLNILRSISDDLKKNNIKFKIVLFPYEYQLRENDYLDPQEKLKVFFDHLNIETVDVYKHLYDYMKLHKIESHKLFTYNDPMHFSALGHKVIKDFLQNKL